jgi:hypothetical protein
MMQSNGITTVATAGIAVAISSSSKPCSRINFQPIKSLAPATANTGSIYTCKAGGSRATATTVLYVLAPGQPAAATAQVFGNDDLSNYAIDADNNGDGCLVSYI